MALIESIPRAKNPFAEHEMNRGDLWYARVMMMKPTPEYDLQVMRLINLADENQLKKLAKIFTLEIRAIHKSESDPHYKKRLAITWNERPQYFQEADLTSEPETYVQTEDGSDTGG